MKEEREILSGIDSPLKKRQGGGAITAPPGKLGLSHKDMVPDGLVIKDESIRLWALDFFDSLAKYFNPLGSKIV